MSPEVERALAYFEAAGLRRFAGASPEQLTAAERRLGTRLPPSLGAFLQRCNGFAGVDWRVLGVPPCERRHDLVGESRTCREVWEPRDLVAVASDAGGERFVLLPGQADDRGECPVAMFDHETGEQLGIVASTYERLVWFVLDDLRRRCFPNGEPRPPDAPGPWPFRDPEWMLQRDPGLARWR
jgi:hypothetical protein